ncbi:MAG: response regulator [Candidatus Omnitrophota bacterium]
MAEILIINDSPSINAMFCMRLEASRFSVDAVETAEEGVEKAKAGQYQLIILDYNLPGMSGAQASQILKKDAKTQNIPILLMSAADDEKVSEILKTVQVDGVISAMADGNELIEKVKSFIKNG